MAKHLQLPQGLQAPALLCWDTTARKEASLWGGKGPAVKLQHTLLENRGGREEEEDECALLEASRSWATDISMAVILPHTKPFQTTQKRFQWV